MTINKLMASRNDECYTPMEAVFPLIKYIPNRVKTIWCPCDTSESKIVKALISNGYDVIATHISNGEDFLDSNLDVYNDKVDMIITNPPYSCKDLFIKRCVELGKSWALLLPLDSLCGKKRYELYKDCDVGVITIADRIDFTGKGKNWFYNAWVCSFEGINGKWIKEKIK